MVFTAGVVLLYFTFPKKWQWAVLLVASAAFYLAGGWKGFFYILVTICSQYMIALALEEKNIRMAAEMLQEGLTSNQKKEIKRNFARPKRWLIFLSVFINLGLLFFLKYIDLAIGSVNSLLGTSVRTMNLLIPLGLSYYTFKSIGYVIDVGRGRVHAQRNIFKLALYVSYFPALVQGPIDRYEDLAGQLCAEHRFDYQRFCFGLQRMLWGYMKKLIIAERMSILITTIQDGITAGRYEGLLVVFMLIVRPIRLYADFSGGMDIVIGLSEIFGISMTENFNRPFLSRSIAEYWRRWHITLGAWMGTYVFTPISLSQPFKKLGKKSREILGNEYGKAIAPSIASFITFFFVGMWHGVSWGYFLFAIYNALLVSTATLLENFYTQCRGKFKVREDSGVFRWFQIVRTFVLVAISSCLYIPDMTGTVKAIFSSFNPWVFFDGTLYTLGLDRPNFILLVLSVLVLFTVDIKQEKGFRIRQTIAAQNIILRWTVYYAAIFALIIFGIYGPGYDAASFIYQRF